MTGNTVKVHLFIHASDYSWNIFAVLAGFAKYPPTYNKWTQDVMKISDQMVNTEGWIQMKI